MKPPSTFSSSLDACRRALGILFAAGSFFNRLDQRNLCAIDLRNGGRVEVSAFKALKHLGVIGHVDGQRSKRPAMFFDCRKAMFEVGQRQVSCSFQAVPATLMALLDPGRAQYPKGANCGPDQSRYGSVHGSTPSKLRAAV